MTKILNDIEFADIYVVGVRQMVLDLDGGGEPTEELVRIDNDIVKENV